MPAVPETPIDVLDLARQYKLLRRADVTRLGGVVLFTEAAFSGLASRPSGGLAW